MSTIQLDLPVALHDRLLDYARREGLSVEQLIFLAAVEKLSFMIYRDHGKSG